MERHVRRDVPHPSGRLPIRRGFWLTRRRGRRARRTHRRWLCRPPPMRRSRQPPPTSSFHCDWTARRPPSIYLSAACRPLFDVEAGKSKRCDRMNPLQLVTGWQRFTRFPQMRSYSATHSPPAVSPTSCVGPRLAHRIQSHWRNPYLSGLAPGRLDR